MKTNLLKMKINTTLQVISLAFLVLVNISCSKEDEELQQQIIADEKAAKINDELMQLQSFSQPDEIAQPVAKDDEKTEKDNQYECTVRTYTAAPGFDQMLALDPTSEVIYPGAMLKGESIPTGEYIGINGGRAPITLSISLENIDGTASVEIQSPELSEVRNGINTLLAQGVKGATPAELNFTIQEVYSEEHLDIALGANYRSKNKDVSASFDFESSKYKYKYIVKFFQEYYTIDMDLPKNDDPGSLFTELPDLSGTSPVIVSSVKYGRMVLYTVESDYQTTDVKSAFNLSFNQGKTEGGVDGDVDYNKIIRESKIEALVIGGSAEDAVAVVDGPSGVYEFIKNGGNYSADSPGKPLAYTLRYIRNDFPIARIVLTSEYPVRRCYEAYQKFRVELYGFNCVDNDGEGGRMEIYGNMSGKVYQNDKKVKEVAWQVSESNFIGIDENKFFKIDKWIEVELYQPDLSKDYITMTAEFWEDDGNTGDDYFGKVTKKILLRDVPDKKGNYYRMNLQEDYDSDMRAYFYYYRINY